MKEKGPNSCEGLFKFSSDTFPPVSISILPMFYSCFCKTSCLGMHSI